MALPMSPGMVFVCIVLKVVCLRRTMCVVDKFASSANTKTPERLSTAMPAPGRPSGGTPCLNCLT